MDHLIPASRLNFAMPSNHKMKIKEKEKMDKYLDLATELKATELNCLESSIRFGKRLEEFKIWGRIKTIQTIALVISAFYLEESWRSEDSGCYSNFSVRAQINVSVKNLQEITHLMYMDDIKLFAKNETELETLIQAVRIYSHNIGMEFGIEKRTMLIMKSRNWQVTEGIELLVPKQKIRKLGESETYK